MTEPLRILNIGGHPKDAILYAGGTIAKHAARGDQVCILTPTTGLSHHLKAIDEYKDLIAPRFSTPYNSAQSAVSPVYVTPAVRPRENR